MGRIRTLKPEMWVDEKIGDLSVSARVTMVGLITMADDEGRLRATPRVILGHVFPFDDDVTPAKLKRWIGEIEAQGIVVSYEVDRTAYLAFRNWARHQRIQRGTASTLPPPPDPEVAQANTLEESANESTYRKSRIPERTRRAVAKRHGAVPGEKTDAQCEKCGAPGSIWWPRTSKGKPGSWVQFTGLDLDHVHPEVHGGSGEPNNIALLCPSCNRSKGSRTDVTESRDDPVKEGHGNPHARTRVRSGPIPSDPSVDELLAKLAECDRFTVDQVRTRVQVENAVGAHPDADHMAAAREAVIWGSSPTWENPDPGLTFQAALRKQIDRLPKPDPSKPDLSKYDRGRESRRPRRTAA